MVNQLFGFFRLGVHMMVFPGHMLVFFFLHTVSGHLKCKRELNRAGSWPSTGKNPFQVDASLTGVGLDINDPEDWVVMVPGNDH